MSSPRSFQRLAWIVGLACAVLLLVLWWQTREKPRRVATAAAPAPAASSNETIAAIPLPAAEPSDPAMRALLAALEEALARRHAREREAVLTFKDEAALRRFLERAQQAGLTVLGRIDALNTVRVRFGAFGALRDDLLGHASDYASVGANDLIGIPLPPGREERAALQHVPFGREMLAFIGATGERGTWGRGTTIAILDTGVARDATFGNGRVRVLDIGLGTSPGRGEADGHGTSVAALAAGASPDAPGVAPAANLLSIRVTDANGLSDIFTVAQAIVAAVDAGAKIINVSLGGYSTGAALTSAIGYATSHDAVVVAAAGNDQAAQLAWPAADPRVVSVGAVDRAEQQVTFSNSGPQLQLSAPGYGVQTAWLDDQRVYVDGTSASAPIVSGAIAALMSQNPNLTARQAADLLASTANDAGQPGADPDFGRGIVNLATAMNSGNLNYVDTAVSSHFYDPETNEMQFVVQNRSGRSIGGMTLHVSAGSTQSSRPVPVLAAGESHVVSMPVDASTVAAGGSLTFSTQLTNPPNLEDQVPGNNRRSSVLTGPEN